MDQQQFSRRHFLRTSSLAAAWLWLRPTGAWGQQGEVPPVLAQGRAAAAKAKIETIPLRGNVSALIGSGGNIAVLPGREGKVVVDSGYRTSQPQLLEAMRAISADPLTQLINTHWHFDHTDGNEWMHAAGAVILAHENTRTRLSTPQTMVALHATLPPAPAGAIPTETFRDAKTLHVNGATLALQHYAPAHTDTDISIYFGEADVLHMGDIWFNGFYPFIDLSSGGNIDGMIEAAGRSLKQAQAATIIIPGHGPIGTRAELAVYRDVLATARDRVAALKKQGRSLDEVVAAKPMAEYDAKWGAGFMPTAGFLAFVYAGV